MEKLCLPCILVGEQMLLLSDFGSLEQKETAKNVIADTKLKVNEDGHTYNILPHVDGLCFFASWWWKYRLTNLKCDKCPNSQEKELCEYHTFMLCAMVSSCKDHDKIQYEIPKKFYVSHSGNLPQIPPLAFVGLPNLTEEVDDLRRWQYPRYEYNDNSAAHDYHFTKVNDTTSLWIENPRDVNMKVVLVRSEVNEWKQYVHDDDSYLVVKIPVTLPTKIAILMTLCNVMKELIETAKTYSKALRNIGLVKYPELIEQEEFQLPSKIAEMIQNMDKNVKKVYVREQAKVDSHIKRIKLEIDIDVPTH